MSGYVLTGPYFDIQQMMKQTREQHRDKGGKSPGPGGDSDLKVTGGCSSYLLGVKKAVLESVRFTAETSGIGPKNMTDDVLF